MSKRIEHLNKEIAKLEASLSDARYRIDGLLGLLQEASKSGKSLEERYTLVRNHLFAVITKAMGKNKSYKVPLTLYEKPYPGLSIKKVGEQLQFKFVEFDAEEAPAENAEG